METQQPGELSMDHIASSSPQSGLDASDRVELCGCQYSGHVPYQKQKWA
jgi:hypothetical protein